MVACLRIWPFLLQLFLPQNSAPSAFPASSRSQGANLGPRELISVPGSLDGIDLPWLCAGPSRFAEHPAELVVEPVADHHQRQEGVDGGETEEGRRCNPKCVRCTCNQGGLQISLDQIAN